MDSVRAGLKDIPGGEWNRRPTKIMTLPGKPRAGLFALSAPFCGEMNSSTDKPGVYLVLGAVDSDRRAILVDLIQGGLGESDRPVVLISGDEPPSDFEGKLPGVSRWVWENDAILAELPREGSQVFFVTDGRRSPVDQIEAFKLWLAAQGGQLARVLCVVNCQLAEKHPPLLAWFEACIHFADVVLLTRREGIANKWFSDFMAHFKGKFYPCLFELVKAGRVKNPALVLEPEARRMSHFLDEEQDWIFTDAEGQEIDEEEEVEDEEAVTVTPEEDPYLARDAAGRRQKRIPDLVKFLS